MDLEKIALYRMSHIQNIPHILKYGITHKSSINANQDFINIGDISLIDNRSHKVVLIDNGDIFNEETQSIILGDYIPFYFGVRMPMLYIIQNGGNFVEKATDPESIVYIACSLFRIIDCGHKYYFSDGHATNNYTSFYNNTKIKELPKIISWESVKASYWAGEQNLNIKRKKQAEFLISGDINSNNIIGYGCYNEVAKQKLIKMGILEENIKIIPQAYY